MALDLDHVLGVLLTAVREIEATRVDVIVGDQDLGVHEIVDSTYRVRRRALRAELRRSDDAVERRDLPRRRRLRAPLSLHLVHLSRIVHTRNVDPSVLDDLSDRAQYWT